MIFQLIVVKYFDASSILILAKYFDFVENLMDITRHLFDWRIVCKTARTSVNFDKCLTDANLAVVLLALTTTSWVPYQIRTYPTLECLNILIDLLSIRNTSSC